ncbi:14656_t:CDS:1, partial [Entrophospora sp. SA101]
KCKSLEHDKKRHGTKSAEEKMSTGRNACGGILCEAFRLKDSAVHFNNQSSKEGSTIEES